MGEIEKLDIYELLIQAGLKPYNSEENNEENGISISAYPHYRNNFGFFHLVIHDSQIIILKGQYSDNIRNIKGNSPLNNAEISQVIDVLIKAEHTATCPVNLELYLCEENCYIKSCSVVDFKSAKRDYFIPRPLTTSEYSEPKSRLYDEEVILSSGYFATYMPEVMSTLTSSIFDNLLDILNPIFTSCNLKTTSPTILPLYGRLYINLTGFEKMMHTIGLNKSLYRRSYAPNLFLKMGISKLDKLNKNFFPVTNDEIEELLESIKDNTRNIDITVFNSKSFYDIVVQLVIIYEYLSIKFTENLSILLKKFPNISLVLNTVYKTRKNSIFYSDDEMILPDYMDFASNINSVTFNMEKDIQKLSKFFKRLPFFSRKSKLKKAVYSLHKLLDLRDELYLLTSDIIVKSHKTLNKMGEIGIAKSKLNSKLDIFFLEHDELKRLMSDTLFGDTKDTISFRKWRNERYKAQVVPPEIYGFDLSETPHISEDMVLKYKDTEAFAVYGLNRINCEGKIETNLDLDDYSDKVIAAYNLPVTKLNNYKNAKGLLIENSSPFSLQAEFAVLNNIPLWTGIRFGELYLDKIEIEKNTLFQVDDD